MKLFLVLGILFSAAFSSAQEVTFSGQSAKFMYSALSTRSNGVEKSTGKTLLLKKEVQYLTLHGLVKCGQKAGLLGGDAVTCKVLGTQASDIVGGSVINLSSDETAEALADLNNAVSMASALRVTGLSASRIFSVLSAQANDSSVVKSSGTTRILKRKFDVVKTQEVSCQKTYGLLGESFKCLFPNVATGDANAAVTVVTDKDIGGTR